MKIKVEDVSVPTSWNELNLRQLKEISIINEKDPTERIKKYIEIVTELDNKLIECLDSDDLVKIWSHIDFIEYVKLEPLKEDKFTIDGVDYGIVNSDYVKVIEYIEGMSYIENPVDKMEYIIVALLRPIVDGKIENYDMEKCNARIENFLENCSAVVSYTIVDFFFHMSQDYTKSTLISLEQKMKEKLEKEIGSTQNGVG